MNDVIPSVCPEPPAVCKAPDEIPEVVKPVTITLHKKPVVIKKIIKLDVIPEPIFSLEEVYPEVTDKSKF